MAIRKLDEPAKRRIETIVYGTLKILPYEKSIRFLYERIGEGTFEDLKIGAVNRPPATIIVNIDWYENTLDEYDIKLILYHESRHLYQWSEIEKWQKGQVISEKRETIEQWAIDFRDGNYIPNLPGQEIQHFQQSCEIDAYFFAVLLMNVEQYNPERFIITNIDYPGISDMILDMVEKQIKSMPNEIIIQYRDHLKTLLV